MVTPFARKLITAPIRFLLSSDVFISYARIDGAGYAQAIANALASGDGPLSCTFDQWETRPGALVPSQILRAARNAAALIVVASPGSMQSRAMDQEIASFLEVPGPIILVSFESSSISAAVWYPRLAGIVPEIETGGPEALHSAQPAAGVLRRIRNAVGYWRLNARIRMASALGVAVFLVAAGAAGVASWVASRQIARAEQASQAADRALAQEETATRRAKAASVAIEAQDILANSPQQSLQVLKLGLQSMGTMETSWGELVIRDALRFTPQLLDRRQFSPPGAMYYAIPNAFPHQMASGPDGALASWSYTGQEDTSGPHFNFTLSSVTQGAGVPTVVELTGFVSDIKFVSDGSAVAIRLSGNGSVGQPQRLAIVKRGVPVAREIPVHDLRAFTTSPLGDNIALAGENDVELWHVAGLGAPERRWNIAHSSALSFSPDGKTVYAISGGGVYSLAQTTTRVATTPTSATDSKNTLSATAGHLVVGGDSLSSFDLASAKWDHDDLGRGDVIPIGGDRLLVRSPTQLDYYDLSKQGTDYYAGHVPFKCPPWHEHDVFIDAVAISGDQQSIALGCRTGLGVVARLTGGYRAAMAPLADTRPLAVWLDVNGEVLDVYATSRKAYSTDPIEGEVTRWKILNSCPGSLSALRGRLALAPDGGGVVEVSEDKITVRNLETGDVSAEADYPTTRWNNVEVMAISPDGQTVALQDGSGVFLTDFRHGGASRIQVPGVGSAISSEFGGGEDDDFAAAEVTGEITAEITVGNFHGGTWNVRSRLSAGSWVRHVQPDDITMSPLSVSPKGDVAYLAPRSTTAKDGAEKVRVDLKAGGSVEASFPSTVSALDFQDARTLVVGTEDGKIYAWPFQDVPQGITLIGQHDAAVLRLLRGASDYVLAADATNVVRMWRAGTRLDEVGLRGFMETAEISYGISGLSYLGVQNLSLGPKYLYTVNRGADYNDYLACWIAPGPDSLLETARRALNEP
ncbi:toll/interleukin-1 receptor domain-containing protein [Mesorhizobium sp. AR02]|uniref:toll/interleukin-1 receptor domain-containing protein n=1 Tax=Mesorhizobium sp. AR02 TaxID=2865837 RepID=UPI00215FBAE7|nr:toll/interleukin-1 receptor domain-containing protein [Mesorhizobium sp. AR02]UVK55364.1 toll/interleukin-1 receptor domain-containing protein [Mesorhizobium sp. AR02]